MVWLLFLALQAPPPEVRVSSHPYVPQTTLTVDTHLVDVAAVVRDSHGKLVQGLTKDDFEILDDGRKTAIEHFSVEKQVEQTVSALAAPAPAKEAAKTSAPAVRATAPPRFLALFIDDVNGKDRSMGADLKRTQVAAAKFVKEASRSGVRIGIFTASGQPKLDFTTDEGQMIQAIDSIRAHVRMSEDGLTGCPRITPYYAYRIAYERDRSTLRDVMYDSAKRNCPTTTADVITQSEETWRQVKEITADTLNSMGRIIDHLGTMPGKREMLMASSGFLAVSMQEQKDKLIDKALRSAVVISALDSKGLYAEATPGSRPEDAVGYPTGAKGNAKAAQDYNSYEITELPFRLDTLNEPMENLAEGTGGTFYHNNNDLAAGFRKLGDPPELTYRLSFRAEGAEGYHKLKVVVRKNSVQARPGYFLAPEKESLQAKIDHAMSVDDTVSEFPMEIAAERDKAGVSVVVKVDISKLRFEKNGNLQMQKLAFVTALTDTHGRVIAAKESTMDFALTDATFRKLAASGVRAKVSLAVPPGAYKLRQVSEEALDGKMACVSHAIAVK